MGAIEKVLTSKVEGLLKQAKVEKSFLTRGLHKCKETSQRRSRPGLTSDKKTPWSASKYQLPDLQHGGSAGYGAALGSA
jgi:hypothetical protein